MSRLNVLYSRVDCAKSSLPVPEHIYAPFYRLAWKQGRDYGIHKLRLHVRQRPNNPLPHMKTPPKNLVKENGEIAADYWLDGYEAAMNMVESMIESMFLNGR